MIILRFLIPLLLLASCSKTKAKYSEEKSETLSYSSASPERGACVTATAVVTQAQKAIAETSKQKDLVVEGSTKGPCPDSLKVLNVDAKVIKKCDSYEDKAGEDQTTYPLISS